MLRLAFAVGGFVAALSWGAPAPGFAQHGDDSTHGAMGELGVPPARLGSGTAWLPDATRIDGYHVRLARWTLMLHASGFLQYDRQFGTRADYQVGSVNWVMAVAARSVAGGLLSVRTMVSAEPLTLTERGYPQLLQVAQPYRGGILTDRQHPHDLVSETAVAYEHAVGRKVALSLYAAAVGEPALGPVAYRHRPSAAYDPTAPLGHHIQDFTHTSFGVVTFGAFTHRIQLEASWFNGAHPDDVRTDFDAVRLDSYAGRLSWNPSGGWSVAAWFGHIAASGGSHAHGALDRFGASVLHTKPYASDGQWTTALIWGANVEADTRRPGHSLLLESSVEFDSRNTLFGRAEYVRRTAADLLLVGSVSPELDVGAVSLGYARGLGSVGTVATSLGVRGTVNVIPEDLRLFYGSRAPLGVVAYVHLRPGKVVGRDAPGH
jgi:hypothetical protein